MEKLKPVFENQNCAIAMIASDEYYKYLFTYLCSIINHQRDDFNYDIIIFSKDFSIQHQIDIKNHIEKRNISVRFCNPSELFRTMNLYVSFKGFSEQIYYRVAIPMYLEEYEKVVMTDVDIIALDDISVLCMQNLCGKTLAACLDKAMIKNYDIDRVVKKQSLKNYINSVLKLSNPYLYFNAGVMIVDVKKFVKNDKIDELLRIIQNEKLIWLDQCAYNSVFNKDFTILPDKFNTPSWRFDNDTDVLLLHYTGQKPWNVDIPFGQMWWECALITPCWSYDNFLLDLKSFFEKINNFVKLFCKESLYFSNDSKRRECNIFFPSGEICTIYYFKSNTSFSRVYAKCQFKKSIQSILFYDYFSKLQFHDSCIFRQLDFNIYELSILRCNFLEIFAVYIRCLLLMNSDDILGYFCKKYYTSYWDGFLLDNCQLFNQSGYSSESSDTSILSLTNSDSGSCFKIHLGVEKRIVFFQFSSNNPHHIHNREMISSLEQLSKSNGYIFCVTDNVITIEKDWRRWNSIDSFKTFFLDIVNLVH